MRCLKINLPKEGIYFPPSVKTKKKGVYREFQFHKLNKKIKFQTILVLPCISSLDKALFFSSTITTYAMPIFKQEQIKMA